MNDKLKKSLRFLWLGYMLFFCLGFIPYFGLLIGFEGEKLATVMLFPMVAWWIFFFYFIASKNLGHEAKHIDKEDAMNISYKIAIISCVFNIVFQVCVVIFSGKISVLPMILSVLTKKSLAVIFAMFALFSSSMILTPLYMHLFTNAYTGYFVKRTTTTYLDFGYSETKTSDKFIKTGQFVKMSLFTSFLSILISITPAVIIALIIFIIKLKNDNKFRKKK